MDLGVSGFTFSMVMMGLILRSGDVLETAWEDRRHRTQRKGLCRQDSFWGVLFFDPIEGVRDRASEVK